MLTRRLLRCFTNLRIYYTKPLQTFLASTMSTTATVQLNTGASMPVLFLGTWKSQPGKVEYAVEYALKTAGYRGIDTATDYENEKEVGQGLAASGVPREDIFLTTKLDNRDHGRIEQALRDSLSSLNTPYIDLWLMHWPAPMLKEGERLLEVAKIVPAVNQIELHPACRQQEIRDFCLQKGIVISAYSPLGSDDSPLLNHPVVSQLAEKHSVAPATVLISLQANIPNTTVLPKSVNKERIDSNSRFIRLTEEEIASLLSIGETLNFRACNPEWAGWGHLGFPDRIKAVQTEAKV
ncbi:hypothetical protein FRC16_008142 [Serendipita sp. 398]|nr:hypothetical protein FRC16_008142 [Serendipita sp. 398]